ncbi:ciliary-associated calcium-binding coiled-coil protein 1-like isoform X3 [Coregonus clupeaformis]|uniref:ciliary-associated calcium-binding coiled-coil protein 1-like isoform X3 n=1 Tax=Coregonus clupeaformis TaxID=59861 RepID=UPI001BE103CF|nr:ciliary-associated calcium-binding coiled-coil protein 1-like isoform X3 [Coregonus clupeaformis]
MSAKAKQTNKSADKNANDRNDVASKENYAEKANPQWKCISHEQINTLLDLTVEQVQLQFEEILGLKNCLTCLKEASLLGYFVCGFWWARQMNYTCQQISFIMALQQLVLDNIREKQMPFGDNLNEFAKLISGTHQSPSPEVDPLFDAEQAMSITDYLKCSLFQNYHLYEFLFHQPREELLLGEKRTIEVISSADFVAPLEEGMTTEVFLHYMAPSPVEQREEGQRTSLSDRWCSTDPGTEDQPGGGWCPTDPGTEDQPGGGWCPTDPGTEEQPGGGWCPTDPGTEEQSGGGWRGSS